MDVVRQVCAATRQQGADGRSDGDGVPAWLLIDLDQHRVVTVGGDAGPLRFDASGDAGHLTQPHYASGRRARAPGDHQLSELAGLADATVRHHQRELSMIFQAPDGTEHVGMLHCGCDLIDTQAQCVQPIEVELHLPFRVGAALHIDRGDARHFGQ